MLAGRIFPCNLHYSDSSQTRMKKILIFCSILTGFGVTGLLAEDAAVSLPATAAPAPSAGPVESAAASTAPSSAPSGKKHHNHKKHHKKKGGESTSATSAPKS